MTAITVSVCACVYVCIKKSNQQSSTVVPGGAVMLVPVTAPVARDSAQKEADDTRQEAKSGRPQQL